MNAQNVLDTVYGGRTMVFGHRGASAYAPMNTLPAFELALAQGADGIELDVHRTKDGHMVVCHNFSVDETTDGSGDISAMTLAEIKALDAGSWFDQSFRHTRIPTLGEVFDRVGRSLFINVEIKSRTLESDGLETLAAQVIIEYGMAERVIVSSFNPLVLVRFRQIIPTVPLGYLTAPDLQIPMPEGLVFEASHPYEKVLDDTSLAQYKAQAPYVNTWTVNDTQRALALKNMGIDGLITDKPDEILRALGR